MDTEKILESIEDNLTGLQAEVRSLARANHALMLITLASLGIIVGLTVGLWFVLR